MKPASRSLLAAALLLLSSCKDITAVQTGYISDRDDCRSRAEYGVRTYSNDGTAQLGGKERNNMLLQLFCECMKDSEWSVAGCKYKDIAKPAATPVPQQPTVVVVQAPPAAAAAAQPQACVPDVSPSAGKPRKKNARRNACPAPEEAMQSELDKVINQQ